MSGCCRNVRKVEIMLRGLVVSLLLGALALPAAAQKCDASKPATAPSSQFKVNDNGTVTDTKSSRVWLRCGLGMSWNGSNCEGKTLTYDWNAAVEAVNELNAKKVAGRSNWRLPKLAELQSIVEKQCFKPAINLDVFPFTPEAGFWSSTESDGVNPRAMMVLFIHGEAYVANKKQSWRIRPVADK